MEGLSSAYLLLYIIERASSPTKQSDRRQHVPKVQNDFVNWESSSLEANEEQSEKNDSDFMSDADDLSFDHYEDDVELSESVEVSEALPAASIGTK